MMARLNEQTDCARMRLWARRFREAAAEMEEVATQMELVGAGELSLAHTASLRGGLLAAEKFVLDAHTQLRRNRSALLTG